MPRLAGVPLSDFLDSSEPFSIKSRAIIAAIEALFEFHQQTGQSHGDASAMNVLIDFQGSGMVANWFDFDVAHTGNCSILNRGDDLRAILSTADVAEFTRPRFANLIPTQQSGNQRSRLLANGSRDVFHLAQQRRVFT